MIVVSIAILSTCKGKSQKNLETESLQVNTCLELSKLLVIIIFLRLSSRDERRQLGMLLFEVFHHKFSRELSEHVERTLQQHVRDQENSGQPIKLLQSKVQGSTNKAGFGADKVGARFIIRHHCSHFPPPHSVIITPSECPQR